MKQNTSFFVALALVLVLLPPPAMGAPATPTIDSVTPDSASTTGGSLITVKGKDFDTSADTTITVTANAGPVACPVPVGQRITPKSITATEVTFLAPKAAAGKVEFKICNANGTSKTSSAFTYRVPLILQEVLPASGLTIGGEKFTISLMTAITAAQTSSTQVLIAGKTATGLAISTTSAVIEGTTPARSAAGKVDVIVTNGEGVSGTLVKGFEYTTAPAPTITQVAPQAGNQFGGTVVTISGTGFKADPNTKVSLSGVGTKLLGVSSTSISIITKAGSAGAKNVVVTNADDQTATATSGFTVVPPPEINSISATTGGENGGSEVTINGRYFSTSPQPTVLFGSTKSTIKTATATAITVTSPATTTGSVMLKVVNPDGQTGVLLGGGSKGFTVQSQAKPIISDVKFTGGADAGTADAVDGTQGVTLVLKGSGFYANAATPKVYIGGQTTQSSAKVLAVLGNEVHVKAPPHGDGLFSVSIINPSGATATLAGAVDYKAPPAPTITSVTETSFNTNGGNTITIKGTEFFDGETASGSVLPKVLINGVAASVTSVAADGKTINAKTGVYSSAVATMSIVVTNPDGKAVTSTTSSIGKKAISLASAPTVTSVSPSAPSMAGGETMTITGTNFATNFKDQATRSKILVNGMTVSKANILTGASATSITFVNPGSTLQGAASVQVYNPDGRNGHKTNAFNFAAANAPQIHKLSITHGQAAGGTLTTITGTGFTKETDVKFGATSIGDAVSAPTKVTSVNTAGTEIKAVTPAGAGAVSVTLTNPDGKTTTGTTFTYLTPASLTASTAATGDNTNGGATVIITSTANLAASGLVGYVGNAPATVSTSSVTQALFKAPAQTTAGAAVLGVAHPNGLGATLGGQFTYTAAAAPTITSVPVTSGSTNGETAVTLQGSGFDVDAVGPTIMFGTATAKASDVTVNSGTSITVKTPPSAGTGLVDVKVTNPDGKSVTKPSSFTYFDSSPPTITSVTRVESSTHGGAVFDIKGTGFDTVGTYVAKVTVGGVDAPSGYTLVGPEDIKNVRAPAHAAGFVNLAVVNPSGQAATAVFNYIAPPAPTSLSPATGTVNGNTPMAINGGSFKDPSVVLFSHGGTTSNLAKSVTANGAAQLALVTPAGDNPGLADVTVIGPSQNAATMVDAYNYIGAAPPAIHTLDFITGGTNGGKTITVTGSGFDANAPPDVRLVGETAAANKVAFCNSGHVTVTGPACATTSSIMIKSVTSTQIKFETPPCKLVTAGGFCSTASTAFKLIVTNPDGQNGEKNPAFTYTGDLKPTLTNINPASGGANGGNNVVLTGTNFGGEGSVKVYFEMDAISKIPTSSSIVAKIVPGVNTDKSLTVKAPAVKSPAKPGQAISVLVENGDGQRTTTLAYVYTSVPSPAITNINPSVGSTNGGTEVTITGTGFDPNAVPTMTVQGIDVPIHSVTTTSFKFLSRSTTSATAVDLKVTNPDGQTFTVTNGFTYVAASAPTIASLAPASGSIAGGTSTVVTGTGFVSGAQVFFGAKAASSVVFNSATQMTVVAPANPSGAVDVKIVNPDTQQAVKANAFTYEDPVAVTGFSPGSGVKTGGDTITITGTGFKNGATVKFGSAAPVSATFVSSTQITAVTPNIGTAGAVTVTVTNPSGDSSAAPSQFSFTEPLTLASATPDKGSTNGGTKVTIVGTGFSSASPPTVTVDGLAAVVDANTVTATSFQFTTPAHAAAGAVNIEVTQGSDKKTIAFTYEQAAAPSLTSLAPAKGPANGGTEVTVTGTGFDPAAPPTVTVDGAQVAVGTASLTATSLTFVTPAHSVGKVKVALTNPDGQKAATDLEFEYELGPAPSLTGVSPTSGFKSGGQTITLQGTEFSTGGLPQVFFGSTAATGVTVASATQITVQSPAGTGTVDVKIVNPDSQESILGAIFEFVDDPDVEDANEDVQKSVKVNPEGDDNVVTWSLAGISPTPTGVQIWRANSPFSLIATFTAADSEFKDRKFTDTSSGATADSRYVVAVFFGEENGLHGHVTDDANADLEKLAPYDGFSQNDFDDLGTEPASNDSGDPDWLLWAIVGGGLLLLLLLIILIIVVARRGGGRAKEAAPAADDSWDDDADAADEPADDGDDWSDAGDDADDDMPAAADEGDDAWGDDDAGGDEPAHDDLGDLHYLKCPSCDHDFTARGTKPFTTSCPSCNAQGVLR